MQADLVLCAPVVEREAATAGIELQAHYAHLLVHGTLHVRRATTTTSDADAARMEALESRLLLAWASPTPTLLS